MALMNRAHIDNIKLRASRVRGAATLVKAWYVVERTIISLVTMILKIRVGGRWKHT